MFYVVALALVAVALVQAGPAHREGGSPSLARRALGITPIARGTRRKVENAGIYSTPPRFLQISAEVKDKQGSMTDEKVQSKQHGGVPLWKEYDQFRRTYYVNALTGEQRWTKPEGITNALPSYPLIMTRFTGDPATVVRQDAIESSKVFETRRYHRMERQLQDTDITLVFQGDVSRLSHLENIARRWQGPVSASLLVLESDIPLVDEMVDRSRAFRHNVDINLCVAKQKWAYYPVNKMRNHANFHARTEYLFIMDGDEDPVHHMRVFKNDLHRAIRSTHPDPNKTAFIVTSWQWGNSTRPDSEYPRSKADLSRLSKVGKAVCKAADFPQAYMPLGVGLEKWLGSKEANKVPWHDRYEPYMVVHKDVIGKFDERFVGWGGNKAIHVLKMQLRNINWVLLPNVFTFTNQSIVEDNAKEHTLPADPDLPERAAMELGVKFGCSNCSYKECIKDCRNGIDVSEYV